DEKPPWWMKLCVALEVLFCVVLDFGLHLQYLNPAKSTKEASNAPNNIFLFLLSSSEGLIFIGSAGLLLTLFVERTMLKVTGRTRPLSEIGGWLILPLAGLIANLVIGVMGSSLLFEAMIKVDGSSPFSSQIAFELGANLILLVIGLYVLSGFIGKKGYLPKWMIILLGAGFLIQLIDVLMLSLNTMQVPQSILQQNREAFDSAQKTGWIAVIASFVSALIWITYFRVSKRVEACFVN
ncbi:MAG TPA: DUF2569 family protein, partial [Blastocatellia bacterium]